MSISSESAVDFQHSILRSIVDALPRARAPAPLPSTAAATAVSRPAAARLTRRRCAHDSVIDGDLFLQKIAAIALLHSARGFF